MEDEEAITYNTFVRSPMDIASGVSSKSTSWVQSIASSYKTPLIIIGVIITAVILAALVPAGMMWKKTAETKGVNINNYNSTQASSNNSNQVDGDMGGIAAATEDEEEEDENEEVKIWKILKKAVHLRSAKEQIAAEDWSKRQDPLQL